jgi:predicted peroxiredoxin
VANRIVIQLTVAESDPERASMAFSVAAVAMASDLPISFWLAGEAVSLGLKDGSPEIDIAYGPDINETLSALIAAKVVSICSPCLARRDISPSRIHSAIKIVGASTFVAELQGEVVPLIY